MPWAIWNREHKKFHNSGDHGSGAHLYVEDRFDKVKTFEDPDEAQKDADQWNLVHCNFDHEKVQTAEPTNVVVKLVRVKGGIKMGQTYEPPPWKGNKWMAERQKRMKSPA